MSTSSVKPKVPQITQKPRPSTEWTSQQEGLRRMTLLKQRKISAQLKLEMMQRELQQLRRTEAERSFYRLQLRELSGELQDLSRSLERGYSLSSSNPSIAVSRESLNERIWKQRVTHQASTPNCHFNHHHLLGELRAVASLSSLNTKPSSSESSSFSKDAKPWKAPLKFLGNLMDNAGFRRRIWRSSSSKQMPSDDPVSNNNSNNNLKQEECTYSSSSETSDDEQQEEWTAKVPSKHIWKPPVVRRVFNNKKVQIDPSVMAEIEDFEKMAAQYIQQHS